MLLFAVALLRGAFEPTALVADETAAVETEDRGKLSTIEDPFC